jgi:multimeric flavodoxin WrbA
MKELDWQEEASRTLGEVLTVWPRMTQKLWKERIERQCSLLAGHHGTTAIDKKLLFEALESLLPPSYEPLLLRWKDPAALKRIASSQQSVDEESPAIEIRRWEDPFGGQDQKLPKKPEEMKVVAFVGSPRKGGSTDLLVTEMLSGAKSLGSHVEKVMLHPLNLSPCTGCLTCHGKDLPTVCVIKDAMGDLYAKILASDVVVLGFPIYTARETAQVATFFDRFDAFRSPLHFDKLGQGKRGALVCTWGWPAINAYNHVVEQLIMLLHLFRIETVEVITASGFWHAYYRKGVVTLHKKGMKEAFKAGAKLVTG